MADRISHRSGSGGAGACSGCIIHDFSMADPFLHAAYAGDRQISDDIAPCGEYISDLRNNVIETVFYAAPGRNRDAADVYYPENTSERADRKAGKRVIYPGVDGLEGSAGGDSGFTGVVCGILDRWAEAV